MPVACVGLFAYWIGRWSYSRNVTIYEDQGYRIAVHRDWPTSGLPLAEYRMLLIQLRAGNTNEAISNLELLLDTTVRSAMHRRTHLSAPDAVNIDKALSNAARYREKYPRPLSEGSGFYWTSDKQLEVDASLEGFRSKSSTN